MSKKIHSRGDKGKRLPALRIAIALSTLLCLASCITTSKPGPDAILLTELAVNSAAQAISNAEQAGVADYASVELTSARENLNKANIAVKNKDMEIARQLAEQARAEAELASARTAQAKAQTVNNDMLKSITTLKQEMQRNNGVQE